MRVFGYHLFAEGRWDEHDPDLHPVAEEPWLLAGTTAAAGVRSQQAAR